MHASSEIVRLLVHVCVACMRASANIYVKSQIFGVSIMIIVISTQVVLLEFQFIQNIG